MIVKFFDRQDDQNPMNGQSVDDPRKLTRIIDGLRTRTPFFCELVSSDGRSLLVGVGASRGCVQYSRSNGIPPYLMAMTERSKLRNAPMEFLTGNTPTSVPARYCIEFDSVKVVVEHFQKTGQISPAVEWDEI